MKLLKFLSVTGTVGMLFVLLGGALVTKTGSEDGCGKSWPLCEGALTNVTPELVIESAHRFVSSAMGIVIILLAIFAWRKIGHIREVKFLSIVAVFFLILQALIGAAAVVWQQSDTVLALHFGISLISFASVLLLTLLVFEVDKKFDARALVIRKGMRIQFYLHTIYIYLVVYTGALVRHMNASLVCGDFPLCSNSDPGLFGLSAAQLVQMLHRGAAMLALVWSFIIMIQVIRHYKGHAVMSRGWIISFCLLAAQAIVGVLVIFTGMNLMVALLHSLIISVYFGIMTYYIMLSFRSAKYEKEH
ncbi:cytochrome c oxidase assembly protein subunit 15 [Terribacillus halophilus]|uniref:Heme A synthase n=1 Tax=Terribacillus halophilus TaxID=361279 RepID=A0A1G6NJI5_9BACI|nr:heme A synthase [Terribacillus halophilus]SDC67781.1 cytochrome c oxidase assembly protein subunit 15 [Terribacillus halophilus]